MLTLPPLALYVHLPWCARKCPYCDFNSHEFAGAIPEEAYIQRLLADLDTDRHWTQGRAIGSIFIGGGTPSLFSAAAIQRLLEGVRERIDLVNNTEITLEANPGSAERSKFTAFRAAGINRLSIGVQSFSDESLHHLGRVHDSAEAHAAIAAAQAAGFERINIDLMHGLPGQTPSAALADIEQAIDHGVTHISWYQLTLEPNTIFHRSPPVLPADDLLADIQEQGHARLCQAGFGRYEVSAYARAGACCRHNLNYWHFGDYIGIGAGAHGKLTIADAAAVLRTWKTRAPRDYLDNEVSSLRSQRQVASDELALEYLMNALRLGTGGSITEFGTRTGLDYSVIAPTVQALRDEGLLVDDKEVLCATDVGYRFLDSVLQRFLSND